MHELLSISQAAEVIGCAPRDISDALYQRVADRNRCARIGSQSAIPREYLSELKQLLRDRPKRKRRATVGS